MGPPADISPVVDAEWDYDSWPEVSLIGDIKKMLPRDHHLWKTDPTRCIVRVDILFNGRRYKPKNSHYDVTATIDDVRDEFGPGTYVFKFAILSRSGSVKEYPIAGETTHEIADDGKCPMRAWDLVEVPGKPFPQILVDHLEEREEREEEEMDEDDRKHGRDRDDRGPNGQTPPPRGNLPLGHYRPLAANGQPSPQPVPIPPGHYLPAPSREYPSPQPLPVPQGYTVAAPTTQVPYPLPVPAQGYNPMLGWQAPAEKKASPVEVATAIGTVFAPVLTLAGTLAQVSMQTNAAREAAEAQRRADEDRRHAQERQDRLDREKAENDRREQDRLDRIARDEKDRKDAAEAARIEAQRREDRDREQRRLDAAEAVRREEFMYKVQSDGRADQSKMFTTLMTFAQDRRPSAETEAIKKQLEKLDRLMEERAKGGSVKGLLGELGTTIEGLKDLGVPIDGGTKIDYGAVAQFTEAVAGKFFDTWTNVSKTGAETKIKELGLKERELALQEQTRAHAFAPHQQHWQQPPQQYAHPGWPPMPPQQPPPQQWNTMPPGYPQPPPLPHGGTAWPAQMPQQPQWAPPAAPQAPMPMAPAPMQAQAPTPHAAQPTESTPPQAPVQPAPAPVAPTISPPAAIFSTAGVEWPED
jgi:hypothetical protein